MQRELAIVSQSGVGFHNDANPFAELVSSLDENDLHSCVVPVELSASVKDALFKPLRLWHLPPFLTNYYNMSTAFQSDPRKEQTFTPGFVPKCVDEKCGTSKRKQKQREYKASPGQVAKRDKKLTWKKINAGKLAARKKMKADIKAAMTA